MLTSLLTRDYTDNPGNLENYFLLSLYWSLGASLVQESREKFDKYVRRTACFTEAPESRHPGIGESAYLHAHSIVHHPLNVAHMRICHNMKHELILCNL